MPLPTDKLARVIINTDAKNEADDQYAIVHALLTPMFELHGIIPAHFGTRKSATSLKDSHDEVMRLLDLMRLAGKVTVADGAAGAISNETTPAPSPGAELIIREALFGIYLLAMFSAKARSEAALAGGIAGAAASYYVAYHSGLSFLWPSTFGLAATLAVGWAVAWIWPAPLSAPGRALTWSAVMRREA